VGEYLSMSLSLCPARAVWPYSWGGEDNPNPAATSRQPASSPMALQQYRRVRHDRRQAGQCLDFTAPPFGQVKSRPSRRDSPAINPPVGLGVLDPSGR
jgi:hypothetical protein